LAQASDNATNEFLSCITKQIERKIIQFDGENKQRIHLPLIAFGKQVEMLSVPVYPERRGQRRNSLICHFQLECIISSDNTEFLKRGSVYHLQSI